MKKSFKILALLLSFVMMISVFVACDNGNSGNDEETTTTSNTTSGEQETTKKPEETTEAMPDVEKKDYDTEFYLSILTDTNPMEHYWVEESDNDVLSAALYERQEKV